MPHKNNKIAVLTIWFVQIYKHHTGLIIQLSDNQLEFIYTTRPTSTRTYIAYAVPFIIVSDKRTHVVADHTCCCRQYMLLKTIHVVADKTCCCRQMMLLQTMHVVADNACCCRPYMLLQTIHVVADNTCCCRQCMLLQTIYVVADKWCCCRPYMLLQTASNRTFTAYAVPFIIVAGNACCCRQYMLLQTASTRTFTAYAVPSMPLIHSGLGGWVELIERETQG